MINEEKESFCFVNLASVFEVMQKILFTINLWSLIKASNYNPSNELYIKSFKQVAVASCVTAINDK